MFINTMNWFARFFRFLVPVLATIFLFGCEGILKLDLVGDGNTIVQKRYINSIKELELVDDFFLEIYQSNSRELFVECDSNLISYIETVVEKEKLIIRRKSNFSLSPRKLVKLRLYIDNLTVISAFDGTVLCDTLNFDQIEINNYGASSVSSRLLTTSIFDYYSEGGSSAVFKGSFNDVRIRQVGSGETKISGTSQTLTIIQEGSGKVDAYCMNVSDAAVSLYGSGIICCRPITNLTVRIRGKGRVYYNGNPNVSSSIEGGGMLIKED